jgi:hypothetical protein
MPRKPEVLARRFCAALAEDTAGRPMQWRGIQSIAARARIRDDKERVAAITDATACRVRR